MSSSAAPVSRALNAAILHIAGRLFPAGFDVAPDAPNDFAALAAHVARTGRMCVYDGASEATIYSDAEVNYSFRAWHDWCHLSGGFPFTPEGERQACDMQIAHLRTVYPGHPELNLWAALLDAEINGQVEYYERTGEFPADQRSFVLNAIQA